MVNMFTSSVLDNDPLLTATEVADLFGVGRRTVARWSTAGLLPCTRTPGGHRRFRRSAIALLIAGGKR